MFVQELMQALAREVLQALEEVAPASVLYPALAERHSGTGTLSSISERANTANYMLFLICIGSKCLAHKRTQIAVLSADQLSLHKAPGQHHQIYAN